MHRAQFIGEMIIANKGTQNILQISFHPTCFHLLSKKNVLPTNDKYLAVELGRPARWLITYDLRCWSV